MNVPTGATPGNLLIAFVQQVGNSGIPVAPAGWAQAAVFGNGVVVDGVGLWWRIVQPGDPSSWTWTLTLSTLSANAEMLLYNGGKILANVNVSASTGAVSTLQAPSLIGLTRLNVDVLELWGSGGGGNTLSGITTNVNGATVLDNNPGAGQGGILAAVYNTTFPASPGSTTGDTATYAVVGDECACISAMLVG